MNLLSNKTILIVANDFTTIRHFRTELLEKLKSEGAKVVLAMPEDDRNVVFEQMGISVVSIRLIRFGTNPLKDLRTMLDIYKAIKKNHANYVLTYTAKPNIYGGLAATLTKVHYSCTVTGLGKNFDKKNFISKIMIALEKIAFNHADAIFFQNKSNLQLLQKHGIAIKNGKIIAGSGVNLENNHYVEYPHNNVIKFLSTARIRKDKGYDELFDVIRRFYSEGIAAEFHIVGWYEDEYYRTIVDDLQNNYGVKFYNYVPNEKMHEYYAKCDCLIQPSHHEGMSNVILEAAATGRPCIVSDIPGCREGVEDEITGLYFQVKNSNDLYEKAKRFVSLEWTVRKTMGISARAMMEELFDRKKVVQTYINTLTAQL